MLLKLVMNFITIALLLYQMTVYYTYYKCSASKIMQIQTYAAYCSCLFVLTLISVAWYVCGMVSLFSCDKLKQRVDQKKILLSINQRCGHCHLFINFKEDKVLLHSQQFMDGMKS